MSELTHKHIRFCSEKLEPAEKLQLYHTPIAFKSVLPTIAVFETYFGILFQDLTVM